MAIEKQKNNYTHILKYTFLFGGVEGFVMLVGLIRNKLVAVILGPEGMGLMSLFNSTARLMSNSTNFGLGTSTVRNLSDSYERADDGEIGHLIAVIRSWSLFTSLFGMLLCVVLSPVLDKWVFGGGRTLHLVFLSVIVAMTAITGGELAILKATRRLSALAKISVYQVIGSLLISIPLYYIWKAAAILPSLIIIACIQMLLTIGYSHRSYPLRFSLNRVLLSDGFSMIRLGSAFMLAAILGSGAELAIRSYLNGAASVETVGLYNAGYMLTMTYAGMVFSAMETDYFPRLSAVRQIGKPLSEVVNKQIEVSLLLISPMLVFFLISVPLLLPLLYSHRFLPLQGMVQVVVFAMYFRAVSLPIAYIPLAKGNAKLYLFFESFYDILLVVLAILGYNRFELLGTGLAITFTTVMHLCLSCYYMNRVYRYWLSRQVIQYMGLQLFVGLMAYAATFVLHGWQYWVVGLLLSVTSLLISIRILRKKTGLWKRLMRKR